jgi:hypothetical protein
VQLSVEGRAGAELEVLIFLTHRQWMDNKAINQFFHQRLRRSIPGKHWVLF